MTQIWPAWPPGSRDLPTMDTAWDVTLYRLWSDVMWKAKLWQAFSTWHPSARTTHARRTSSQKHFDCFYNDYSVVSWGEKTLNGTVQKILERCLNRSTWTEREKQPFFYRIHVFSTKSIPEISKMTFSTSGHDRKYQILFPVYANQGYWYRMGCFFH